MQATLTLLGDFAELQTLLARLNGSAGTITMHADKFNVATGNAEDDDTPNATPPALDSAGIPHDERIHAGSKGVNKDGTWKRKRGVDDATVAAVESELRQKIAAMPVATPAVGAPVTLAPMPGGVPLIANGEVAAPTTTPPVPAMPGAAVSSVPPMPQGDNAAQVTPPTPAIQMPSNPQPADAVPFVMPTDFNQFMQVVQTGMQAGKIDNDYLAALVQEINGAYAQHNISISGIVGLAQQHPSMINYAVQLMQRDGKVPA